jgi:hypothetical protein
MVVLITTGYVTDSGSYGLFLPDIGTILLNPAALSQSIHVDTTKKLIYSKWY